jgi:hypothetical protein
MKTINKTIAGMAITATLLFNFFLLSASIKPGPVPVKNIVLVHGAFVDGSGWKPVYDPAWRLKPSWYLVAGADRIISPGLQCMYAKRANSNTVEIQSASHSVFESHPKEVAQLIIRAATKAGKK